MADYRYVHQIIHHDEEGNGNRLRNFEPIDPCINVDGVWAKDGDGGHVNIVSPGEVHELTKVWL